MLLKDNSPFEPLEIFLHRQNAPVEFFYPEGREGLGESGNEVAKRRKRNDYRIERKS